MSRLKRFLTLREVAERYGVTYMTAYNWVRSGRLPAFQVGGRGVWRVELSEVERVEKTKRCRAAPRLKSDS